MRNCKLASRPVRKATIIHKKLCLTNKIEIKAMENVPYAQVIGSLMHVIISTRPDKSHAVRVVFRYNQIKGKHVGEQLKEL